MIITTKKLNTTERYRKRFIVDQTGLVIFTPRDHMNAPRAGAMISLTFGPTRGVSTDHMNIELESEDEAKAFAFNILKACGWKLEALNKSSAKEIKGKDIIQSGAQ